MKWKGKDHGLVCHHRLKVRQVGRGTWPQGRRGPRRFIGLVSEKNQDSLRACHETSPPPESQLNRSTVPKDSESSRLLHLRYAPSSFLLLPTRPSVSLPHLLLRRRRSSFLRRPLTFNPLARFLSRQLKSDFLSPDPIRHASRLMSGQPAVKRGFRAATEQAPSEEDNCPVVF